jgi:MoaA/NifB/PqqE/SkfB family radical SAM enzyme
MKIRPNSSVNAEARRMIRKISQSIAALATRKLAFEIDLIPLRFEGLPRKKITNWLLTESSVVFKPARPWGLPTILQVEPTNRCNLRCGICPVATGLGRPVGDMDLPRFRQLIDELGETLLLVLFWDWGEPFLNPDAYAMIRYARAAGVRVVCSTNGHVFADREHARRVVDSGLDVLVFSVDGITQETYRRVRRQGNLETVLQGIRNVVEEKGRARSSTPLVNFRFIVMKHGESEVPQVRAFASSLGVDVLTLRKFHFVPGTGGDNGEGKNRANLGEQGNLVPHQTEYQFPALPTETGQPLRVERNPCKNLWNCPTVHWDGTVCSCFMDYKEQRALGSLEDRSFRDIWYGEAYRRLRRGFRRKWKEVDLCKECASGFQGGDLWREANAEALFFRDRG